MATIASVDVALTASSVDLRRGLDRAERATRNYTNRAGRAYRNLGRQVRTLQAGFVGLLATIGVGRILQSVDELSTLADQSGIAVDRFSQLSTAFAQQGLNASQFANALRGLSVRLFQFGQGTGEAVMAFEQLGLTFQELQRQSPEQRLFTIIDALSMVEDATERAFLASRIFGEEVGPRLSRAIALGSGALQDLAANSNALSEDDVANIRNFNDTITALGQNLTVLLSRLSPVLNGISSFINVLSNVRGIGTILTGILGGLAIIIGRTYVLALARATAATRTAISAWISQNLALTRAQAGTLQYGRLLFDLGRAQRVFVTSLALSSNALLRSNVVLQALTFTLRGFNIAVNAARIAILRFAAPLIILQLVVDTIISLIEGRFIGSVRVLANALIFVANQVIRLSNLLGFTNSALIDYIEAADSASVSTDDLTVDFGELEDQLMDTNGAVDTFQTMLRSLLDTLFPAEAAQRRYFESVRLLGEAYDQGLITLEQYTEALRRLREQYQALPEEVEEVTEELSSFEMAIQDAMDITDELSDLGVRAFDGLADSLTDFITTGMANFRRFAQSIIRDLIRIQIRRALAFAIGGGGGGSIFGSILGRQNGGPVNAGQPYIVGEAGPELFVPRSGGSIVPNNELGGGGMTVNITAVDTQSFQEALARDPRFISNLVARGDRAQGRT